MPISIHDRQVRLARVVDLERNSGGPERYAASAGDAPDQVRDGLALARYLALNVVATGSMYEMMCGTTLATVPTAVHMADGTQATDWRFRRSAVPGTPLGR